MDMYDSWGISMITMLAKIFIKNRPAKEQRQAYGTLCSIVGICLNVCLFAGKYFAGMLSGSVAITADAFNNLSDAGSSFITLAGFLYAGKLRIRSTRSDMGGLNMCRDLL